MYPWASVTIDIACIAIFQACICSHADAAAGEKSQSHGIPVILDTDIGSDIDDSWAIGMMLKSPELDVRLITSASDNTPERAKLVAKMLQIAGRTDIPIGIGVKGSDANVTISPWTKDFDMKSYGGKVYDDGVNAIIDTVMHSKKTVTLICIGPLTNIAEALKRAPQIASKVRLVGMQGSVYRGYEDSLTPSKEYNIIRDIPAAQKVFSAKWKELIITPLDTCCLVRLTGDKFRAVESGKYPITKSIIESYNVWLDGKKEDKSSILCDTVAIYLASRHDLLDMKTENLRVTDDGMTVPDPKGNPVNCALSWKDLPAYEDLLVRNLTNGR